MKTKKRWIIVVAFNALLEDNCDYAIQTIRVLSKDHRVFGLALGNPYGVKDIVRDVLSKRFVWKVMKNRQTIIRPLFIVPGQRVLIIKRINYFINVLVLRLVLGLLWQNEKKVFWFFEPFTIRSLWSVFTGYKRIYDCVDYFRLQYPAVEVEEDFLLRNSDVVVVNSYALYRRLVRIREDIVVASWGFAVEMFKKKNLPTPTPRKNVRVGYIGGINYRLDYQMIYKAAKELPSVIFDFVGPIQLGIIKGEDDVKHEFNALLQLPNVEWRDNQPKTKIAEIINDFDICIIPYDARYAFNRYCHPMKLLEYFYMQKPVISTPIEVLNQYGDVCLIAGDASEFMNLINTIMKTGWSKEKKLKQRKFALDQTWEKRIASIIAQM